MLSVPIFQQPDETTCGPTCLHSIYQFYEKPYTLESVIDNVDQFEEGGTIGVLLANDALAKGFKTTIYTYNLQIFDPTWFGLNRQEMIDKLKAQLIHKQSKKLEIASKAYIRFLELGGRLKFEDLRSAIIRRYLKQDRPIIAGLSATYLYKSMREYGVNLDYDDLRGEPAGHFVVLHGYDIETREVYIADPIKTNPTGNGTFYKMKIDRVINAILLGIVTYDANLIIITPKINGLIMQQLIVVDNPKKWALKISGVNVISARAYLSDSAYSTMRNVKVFNLCKSYRYQSLGYYVSLLASARGHKPVPNILAIQDLKSQAIIRIASSELDSLIQKSLKPIQGETFTLSIYFGKNLAKRHNQLSQKLFAQFQAPLMRAEFIKKDSVWILRSLQPIASNDVPEDHKPFVSEMAGEFFNKRTINRPKKETRYDLAILVNPDEEMPPSDEKALRKFIKAAESLDFYVEQITKDDYPRLNEFDALFIRETTSVNHHTYRMARRAAAEGLVVIDDPESILTCTNKVYLAELLNKNRVPAPDTVILNRDNIKEPPKTLGFPLILKQPDSSFSQGVLKVDSLEDYNTETDLLFKKSDLLIAQKFIPTPFDWRIGILNGKPLYACRYHMARKHWQIYERTGDGKTHEGQADTLPIDEVPQHVLKNALKAAQLIGDGLYGVDLKEIYGEAYVIEVNDNPNIDSGIEDEHLKNGLYTAIMKEFLRRIELKKERRAQ